MGRTNTGRVDKHIAKDGTVTYRVRVTITDPVTGETREPQKTFKTSKAAEAYRRQWVTEIEDGTAVDPSKQTLGAYLEQWLTTSVQHTTRPTTAESYRDLVRVHVVPALGRVALQKLTPSHLQTFYSDLLTNGRRDGKAGGLSQRSVRYIHAILHRALKEAVSLKLTKNNAADAVRPPKAKRPQVPSWDADTVQSFLSTVTDDGYSPIWQLALHTGMRRGELLGLRWQDVDLEHGKAQISRSLVMVANKPAIQEPKTEHGKRTIALDADSLATLREHRTRQIERRLALGAAWQDLDLVFANKNGGYVNPHNLDRRFGQLIEQAGVPRIPLHGLRHTHATVLMKSGVNPKIVSDRLGHGDIAITLSTYSHVLPEMDQEAADAFAKAVRKRV